MQDYVYVNSGLGKPFWKKIRIKDVSLKNVVKLTKTALPIATSLIPVGGSAVSGILSKALKKTDGSASFIGKIANTATSLSKTTVGKAIVSTVKNNINPQVQAVSTLKPAPVVANPTINTGQYDQPVGDLTPVSNVSNVSPATALQPLKTDNTVLYILGGVALVGGIYLATKKS